MYPQPIISPSHQHIPMIDMEFDRFDVNNDLEFNLREAETATFYHNALDSKE